MCYGDDDMEEADYDKTGADNDDFTLNIGT